MATLSLLALLALLVSHGAVTSSAISVVVEDPSPVRGYGRYPCKTGADCASVLPGTTCALDPSTGNRFCGIYGSSCKSTLDPKLACDGGYCYKFGSSNFCLGGYGDSLFTGVPCLGSLGKNSAGVCGVVGSDCGTVNQHGSQSLYDAYDQNCQTNYCNTGTFQCGTRASLGQSCAFDPIRGCQAGLFPNIDAVAQTCVCLSTPQPGPSGRARVRARERRELTSLCPASHTACSVGSAGGYECIDTSSNLEQCGGCATDGGVDCTALEGVSAVGCVEGQCEIWRCEDGWTFDAVTAACVRL